ncbi:hypothetical protein VNO80_33831 [Phaseolus coccineus]|uniref:Uncharacterized protein n=1 Tax=Phaseolus coccineus TaxID=3886 RepID=A0AAN9Q8S0_PHACN
MCAEDSSFNSISDIHHQKEDLTLALGSVYAWTDWTSIRFSTYRDFLFLSEPDSAWATRKGNEIFGEQDGTMGGSGIKAFAFLLVVNCRDGLAIGDRGSHCSIIKGKSSSWKEHERRTRMNP